MRTSRFKVKPGPQMSGWAKALKGSHNYKDPENCLHTERRWRGGFNWDCLLCGEAVIDREEKTQTTFSSILYTEG